ncbi:MAG: hypothetical protein QOE83_600, partial [Actinomycetota bacterium]|nr:hypothetical protein [Actinomycetota bacterium]
AATIALAVTVQISSVAAITLAKAVAKRIHKIRPKTNGVVKVLCKPDATTLAEVRVEDSD